MRFTIAATAAFVSAASATYGYGYEANVTSIADVYTTEYVTDLSEYYQKTRRIESRLLTFLATVCPGPTAITIGGQTHTVTEATTLTISDCSCTITKPVPAPSSAPAYSTEVPSSAVPVTTEIPASSGAPIESYPIYSSAAPSAPAPYPSANGTLTTVVPSGTGAPTGTSTSPPAFTGAATKMGAGIAAIAAAAAAFL
jgi:hypothetical protein